MQKVNTREERFSLIKNWVNENIYNFRKGDSVAYLVLYILIPVIITAISLMEITGNNISIVYCYITILISALNSIYDGANRWDSYKKSIRNVKIFIIFGSNAVVAIYCIYVIFYILIRQSVKCRFDWVLLSYFVTIAVALSDIIACFSKEMTLQNCVGKGEA